MFNAIFNNISVTYCGGQIYWWGETVVPEKTADLSQLTDKHHVMLYREQLTMSACSTFCICSCLIFCYFVYLWYGRNIKYLVLNVYVDITSIYFRLVFVLCRFLVFTFFLFTFGLYKLYMLLVYFWTVRMLSVYFWFVHGFCIHSVCACCLFTFGLHMLSVYF